MPYATTVTKIPTRPTQDANVLDIGTLFATKYNPRVTWMRIPGGFIQVFGGKPDEKFIQVRSHGTDAFCRVTVDPDRSITFHNGDA